MTTFLNIDLDGKTPKKFIWKHFIFSFLWIIGILVLFFRIDIIFFNKQTLSIDWLEGTIPIIMLSIVGIVMLTQKWYYNLALISYPILALVWFIPKTVLNKGKIYLFLHYINYIFNLFKNFKLTIFNFVLFCFSILLLLIVDDNWVIWFALVTITYFYFSYLLRYFKKSFQPAQLFGNNIESIIDDLIVKGKKNESILITNFLIKVENDNKLEENKNKNLSRLLIMNYALDKVSNRLNSFKGKRAFVLSLMYELGVFLISSIIFFWFVNYQLYHIDKLNFEIKGIPTVFEFLYYTIKNITFSDIESIKPLSWVSKLTEIFSFLVIGVLFLIVIISMVFALRNDKINENVKLTTALCKDQNRIIKEYMLSTYGKDIETALTEVSNIGKSLKILKNIIDNIF